MMLKAEFERVLSELRDLAISEHDKGKRFERLTVALLRGFCGSPGRR